MLKVTSVDNRGCESFPQSVEVNSDGYILLPEDPNAVSYNVYAPLKGFEETGPWYWKRAYKRGEARRARFTVVGLYEERDLVPQLCPQDSRPLPMPDPMPGQEFWYIYGGSGHPFAIVECP